MEPIVNKTGFVAGHLYRAGEPQWVGGREIKGIDPRHYASLACTRGDDEDVIDWIRSTLQTIRSHQQLVHAFKGGEIEGLIWIARLRGGDESPMPSIPSSLIKMIVETGLKCLLENYTQFDTDGAPQRTWIPA